MPVHDWTKVHACFFRSFSLGWIVRLKGQLNNGLLPPGYYAMIEANTAAMPAQPTEGLIDGLHGVCDVETLHPMTTLHFSAEGFADLWRQQSVAIRHEEEDQLIARFEIMLPGLKTSRAAQRVFVTRAVEGFRTGVHLLVVDILPPRRLDPHGVHGVLWDEIGDEAFVAPTGLPLTLAAYCACGEVTAYVEPIAVDQTLPDMPLFLSRDAYVRVPLEDAYRYAWEGEPQHIQKILDSGHE